MKDAYYFKHDANARHDPKLLALRALHGMAGIGRFWCVIEMLREQTDYTLNIANKYNRAALQRELEFATMEEFDAFLQELFELGLLAADGGKIFSVALVRRMTQLERMREQRVSAGKASAVARTNKQVNELSTSVQRTLERNLERNSNERSTNLERTLQRTLERNSNERSKNLQRVFNEHVNECSKNPQRDLNEPANENPTNFQHLLTYLLTYLLKRLTYRNSESVNCFV